MSPPPCHAIVLGVVEREVSSARRGFLVRVVLALHGLIGLAFGATGAAYVLTPVLMEREDGDWVPIVGAKPPGAGPPRRVALTTRTRDGYTLRETRLNVWVVEDPSTGEAIVLSGACTHLGCNLDWSPDENLFACPCHGGRFDRIGRNVAGPPPRPLDRYPIKVIDGVVFVRPVTERA